MAKVVPFTEARARLSELLDSVEGEREHVVVTRSGRPVAVLLSIDEYESLEETIDVLGDQGLLDDLRESEAEVARGDLVSLEDVQRDLGGA